jgi:hypothetical protein
VAKALGLRAWSWQDIEVLEGPTLVLHGKLAGALVDVSLTHSRGMAGGGRGGARVSAALARPAARREQMRATDAGRSRSGRAVARAHGGAGRPRDLVTEVAPSGVWSIACGGGNNGGDGSSPRGCCATPARGGVAVTTDLTAQGDAGRTSSGCPAGPVPFDPGVLDGAAVAVDALLGTGFNRRAAPSRSARRSSPDEAPAGRRLRRAQRRRRLDRGGSRTSRSARTPPRPSTARSGAVDRPRQGARGHGARRRHRECPRASPSRRARAC